MKQAESYLNNDALPSLDFVAGLVAGEGCFTWIIQNGHEQASFQIKMPAWNRQLLEQVRTTLNLTERIHEYIYQERHFVCLYIRKRSSIEDKIIPVFTGRLFGKKAAQFYLWKEKYFEKITFRK
ncbi:MAG: LAGLIDADG family homing endonuclease [Bacteroidota bacterium]